MNSDKLDGLMVDYSLGAVPEDVAILLEALAEKDADFRERIDQWRGVADLARRADESPRTALPAFPRQRLESARYARQARRAMIWTAAAAACIAVGFFGGLWRQIKPSAPPQTHVVTVAPAEAPVASVADFWSVSRLRAEQEQRARIKNGNGFGGMTLNEIRQLGGRS